MAEVGGMKRRRAEQGRAETGSAEIVTAVPESCWVELAPQRGAADAQTLAGQGAVAATFIEPALDLGAFALGLVGLERGRGVCGLCRAFGQEQLWRNCVHEGSGGIGRDVIVVFGVRGGVWVGVWVGVGHQAFDEVFKLDRKSVV